MTVAGIAEKINRGVIKSVQRGTISGSAAGSYYAYISPVNMKKAHLTNMGQCSSTYDSLGRLSLDGPGTVVFTKVGTSLAYVTFELIEYY